MRYRRKSRFNLGFPVFKVSEGPAGEPRGCRIGVFPKWPALALSSQRSLRVRCSSYPVIQLQGSRETIYPHHHPLPTRKTHQYPCHWGYGLVQLWSGDIWRAFQSCHFWGRGQTDSAISEYPKCWSPQGQANADPFPGRQGARPSSCFP